MDKSLIIKKFIFTKNTKKHNKINGLSTKCGFQGMPNIARGCLVSCLPWFIYKTTSILCNRLI
jgi:hypothetical protein